MTMDVGSDDGAPDAEADSGRPQEILDRVRARAEAEAGVSEDHAYGRAGNPFDRRAPYFVGLYGAFGVATAFVLAWIAFKSGHVLTLIGLAFFIAVGLDPAVTWLARHRLPRWAAVITVLVAVLGTVIAFFVLALPVVIHQGTQLANDIPHLLRSLNDPHSTLGKLNLKYHLVKRVQQFASTGGGSAVTGGVVSIGQAVLSFAYAVLVVSVVAVYLLADLPRIKRGIYHLAPRNRRPRMVLLTDEILSRVGGYVLGNLAISLISAVLTVAWALVLGIPYPLLLGVTVGLLDLVPLVGSTIGGAIVALVALLAVSPAGAVATVAFFLGYRFAEDYLLTPRIMGRTVDVPPLVTVVAVLIGGTILGLVGAIVAIPVAAAIKLLLEELAAPQIDRS